MAKHTYTTTVLSADDTQHEVHFNVTTGCILWITDADGLEWDTRDFADHIGRSLPSLHAELMEIPMGVHFAA